MTEEEVIEKVYGEMCAGCSEETICHKIAQFCDGFWERVDELEGKE